MLDARIHDETVVHTGTLQNYKGMLLNHKTLTLGPTTHVVHNLKQTEKH